MLKRTCAIAKLTLKPGAACAAGQAAGYDPADGGMVQPVPPRKRRRPRLVPVGRFAECRDPSAEPQTVSVWIELPTIKDRPSLRLIPSS